MPISLELMPLEEKAAEAPPPGTLVVRYGYLREIGEFASDLTARVGCGTKVVLRTPRGTEIGEMLTTMCGNGGCDKSITREKLLSYIEQSGGRHYPFSQEGRVLRVASAQDIAEQAKLDEHRLKHLTVARGLVQAHRVAMKIVEVEHVLGGERILFYFVAERRVDFRSLVRDLAHSLHTRIELRQVGARDEARLTADYEKCGQHCCCKQFLKVLTPISMRAAKVQKATLDPTKISGRCGRLMCCLRYEDETYEALRKRLPKRNTRVQTEAGDAWVLDGQILTQLVLVQYDDGKREAVPMEKILGFDRPRPVLPDGRTMQTPNDRPPPAPIEPRGRGGRSARPPAGGGGTAGNRPNGGPPAHGPGNDRRATGDSTADEHVAHDTAQEESSRAFGETYDEIDELIADAMDVDPRALSARERATGPQRSSPSSLPKEPRRSESRHPKGPRQSASPTQKGARPGQPHGSHSPKPIRPESPPPSPPEREPPAVRPGQPDSPGVAPGNTAEAGPSLPPPAAAAPPPPPAPESPTDAGPPSDSPTA